MYVAAVLLYLVGTRACVRTLHFMTSRLATPTSGSIVKKCSKEVPVSQKLLDIES